MLDFILFIYYEGHYFNYERVYLGLNGLFCLFFDKVNVSDPKYSILKVHIVSAFFLYFIVNLFLLFFS